MITRLRPLAAALVLLTAGFAADPVPIDWATVARIREEGLQRSRVMEYESYMTDVLGARLTASQDMRRAQAWVQEEMKRIGLRNVAAEPFMEFGASWDNEYTSLHLLEPDYSPMVGYPLAHTPGTNGKVTADVVIADIQTRQQADSLRGNLAGKAVLSTPQARIDMTPLVNGMQRRTEAELDSLERLLPTPAPAAAPRVANPDLLTAEQKMAFFKAEGVAAVLESQSGWLGAVRGFSRPGSRNDRWSAAGDSAVPPIIAITPEHYNRMYRVVERGIPVTIELEVRNRIGTAVEQAVNIIGEIPGSDLKDEIVMIGAHFDTWHASSNATDNTSGTAVVLEAARILNAIGAKPRRTIRVALWSGEEQGLWGSRGYVRQHFGDPRDPTVGRKPGYEKLYAYFNQDYGPGLYRGIALQGNEGARRLLSAWMEPFRDWGMTAVSIQSLCCTDHVPFDEVGLPGFQFIQDRVPGGGGHSNLDPFEVVPADDLMKNAVIMASYAWHAANSEEAMPRETMPPTP
ncbi:MAG: M20/M25/M40 family metallo-hydrolase [Gemmatimonadota bacterium]|nr:M20/M25/M40 family metallo-hydrolase [Gemmatimonadota bacterium]